MKFPGVTPAVLSVELISLDTATRTISARLTLIFTGNLVSHLQFSSVSYPGLVPLTKVPAHVWAKLPVDIRLISCGRVKRSGSCPPIASIPLGQLDPYGRGGSGSVETAVTLPIIGWPGSLSLGHLRAYHHPRGPFPQQCFSDHTSGEQSRESRARAQCRGAR